MRRTAGGFSPALSAFPSIPARHDLARRVDASDQRVYVPIAGEGPRRTIAACWNPYRYQSRLARAFLEQLRGDAAAR